MPPPALGRTATASPQAATAPPVAAPAVVPPAGFAARCTRVLLSPWSRLSLLLVLLASAATCMLLFEPQRLVTHGWPPQFGGVAAAAVFALAYGPITVAFVPRPLLNLAAGALFGSELGTGTALVGTVLGPRSPSGSAGRSDRTRCARCCGAAGSRRRTGSSAGTPSAR